MGVVAMMVAAEAEGGLAVAGCACNRKRREAVVAENTEACFKRASFNKRRSGARKPKA